MYTIKQVSEMLGITKHAIRYYTDLKLFPCKRDSANRRVFDEEAVNWLIGIKNLRTSGMSVESVKQYCALCMEGDSTINRRYQIIMEQKELARIRLEESQKIYDYMEKKSAHYQDIVERRILDNTNPTTWKNKAK